jgi:small subunit ribosomal protein S11
MASEKKNAKATKVAGKAKPKKKKKKLTSSSGIVHIHSTVNNTIVTITDEAGQALT